MATKKKTKAKAPAKKKAPTKPKSMPPKKKTKARSTGSRSTPKRKTRVSTTRTTTMGAAGRNIMAVTKSTLAGATGGVGYGLAASMIPGQARPWVGLGIGAALIFAGLNNVGAGMAGAASFDFMRNQFGLADGQDVEYVNPTILSDNYALSDSESMDDQGNVYALSDDGRNWEYVGTIANTGMSPQYNYPYSNF